MKKLILVGVALVMGLAVGWPASAFAVDDAQKCESYKLKHTGKYGFCQMKAESKFVKTGDAGKLATDLGKCNSKMSSKFATADSKWGGSCPAGTGDLGTMQDIVTQCTDDWAVLLSGGSLPDCGNNVVEGDEQCDGTDLAGATCESLVNGSIGTLACTAACQYDVSGCQGVLPATGQTTCYLDGSSVSCGFPTAGQDGEVQAGAVPTHVWNGDGTVTDLNTGLMWEVKSDNGDIHDFDDTYPWSGTCSSDGSECLRDAGCLQFPSPQTCAGTTIFEWVDQLNQGSFAGYTDWRIPNVRELQSIVDYGVYSPSVIGILDSLCVPGCDPTVLPGCACTQSSLYWSATTYAGNPFFAWDVGFDYGYVSYVTKPSDHYVRAVRGGLW